MVANDDEIHSSTRSRCTVACADAPSSSVVPGTSHGLLHEKPAFCNRIMLDFLMTDPVSTIVPVRRAKGR